MDLKYESFLTMTAGMTTLNYVQKSMFLIIIDAILQIQSYYSDSDSCIVSQSLGATNNI